MDICNAARQPSDLNARPHTFRYLLHAGLARGGVDCLIRSRKDQAATHELTALHAWLGMES